MALVIRLDIDRPYGRTPVLRHVLSRISSDFYLPRRMPFGFLAELKTMLLMLTEAGARSYVFFRRCTLPSPEIVKLMDAGGHQIGLHLENSRSLFTFLEEKNTLERHVGRTIAALSKHGSGGTRFGYHHYAPYEPDRYVQWCDSANIRLYLGNLQDPTLPFVTIKDQLTFFPAAFWLEPAWRDTARFPVDWLLNHGHGRDIVLLIHPENVLRDAALTRTFVNIVRTLPSKILS